MHGHITAGGSAIMIHLAKRKECRQTRTRKKATPYLVQHQNPQQSDQTGARRGVHRTGSHIPSMPNECGAREARGPR